MTNEQKRKGDLLEDVTALLHRVPGARVECRKFVPVPGGSSTRTREIDVLVTFYAPGYEMQLAIECKNCKNPIGVEQMDAFFGKLDDIGISPTHGIFVSPVGFTSGALDRASRAGIRPLLFKGLTTDRLAKEIHDAFQSSIYLTATWRSMSWFEDARGDDGPGLNTVLETERHGTGMAGLLTVLWHLWISKQIPGRLGEHTISIHLPPSFALSRSEPPKHKGVVIADVEVHGHVATLRGTATCLRLHDASSGQLETLRIDAQYRDAGSGPIHLIPFRAETELSGYLRSGCVHVHIGRLRVPRIIHDKVYWPPSEEALKRICELRAGGNDISFSSVETNNLARAWQVPIWEGSG